MIRNPFAKKPDPTPEQMQAESDAALAFYASKGIKLKDRNVSHALLREDRPGTWRVICLDCTETFDLFGTLTDARTNGGSESTIVQAVMEHQGQCSGREHPVNTTVYQNRNTLSMYGLAVTWQPIELTPQKPETVQ